MRILIAALLAIASSAATATDDAVELTLTSDNYRTIAITIGGEPFATYRFEGFKKPFLSDIRAPGGTVITRSLEKEAVTDHPHHKGLWVGVDEVNEHKHWMEAQPVRTANVEILKTEDKPAFRAVNLWLDDDGKPLLKETTTVSVLPDRLVAYDMTLTPAGDEAVTFGDTKEGFFAIRVRDELREKGGTGKITNSHGATGEKDAWGKTAPWVDYSGTVEGKPVGVAIFDHPENVRPSRYHVRAYGLFAISPFGEHDYTNGENAEQPIMLKPGETLRLRYAAFVHAGDAASADVAGRYEEYVKQSK